MILDISQPYKPLSPVTGIANFFFLLFSINQHQHRPETDFTHTLATLPIIFLTFYKNEKSTVRKLILIAGYTEQKMHKENVQLHKI
jgi:hypothetical protein